MTLKAASNAMLLVAALVVLATLIDARIGIVLSVLSMVGFAVYLRRATRG